MKDLSNFWLDAGEKIEAFREDHVLRFVTTKTKAELLMKDLHETLTRVTAKTFPFHIVSPEPIDDALLEEVGRITDTHVTQRGRTRVC